MTDETQKLFPASGLTPRECEVVAHIARGLSTGATAARTGLTTSTVNTYLKRVFAKLGVHTRAQLTAWAHRTYPTVVQDAVGASPPKTIKVQVAIAVAFDKKGNPIWNGAASDNTSTAKLIGYAEGPYADHPRSRVRTTLTEISIQLPKEAP